MATESKMTKERKAELLNQSVERTAPTKASQKVTGQTFYLVGKRQIVDTKMVRIRRATDDVVTDVRILSPYGDFMGEMRQNDVLELPETVAKEVMRGSPKKWEIVD